MSHFQRILAFSIILFNLLLVNGYVRRRPTEVPKVLTKTLGHVWPKPQYILQHTTSFKLDKYNFRFAYEGEDCPLLNDAFVRYKGLIFHPPINEYQSYNDDAKFDPTESKSSNKLQSLKVEMQGKCESYPYHGMNESYQIQVVAGQSPTAQLVANSTWGIIRGLETFSQLVYRKLDSKYIEQFYINETAISDFPRFPFRGFLLDTSRHFIPVKFIQHHLDAMAYNKFNVFHWHITDDQSFPYQSSRFPSLSKKGAFHPSTHVYSSDDVLSIINYAAERGIRVIPEFDTPDHVASWGKGIPDLLTPCYTDEKPDGTFGPINPTLNSTYKFLYDFFAEAGGVFPEKYFHLGGDEVDFDCWASNPNIIKFMKKMGFGNDFVKLENYYMNKLMKIVSSIPDNKNYIVWQDVLNNGCELNKKTVINVWQGDYRVELASVTSKGYQAVLSSCWYLNYISSNYQWSDFYTCEPRNFTGSKQQHDLVIGGTGCMWGEFVDATNLIARTWPRAAAVAERLWSAKDVNDYQKAIPRFEEHRCRMLERNIKAEPENGPSFCSVDFVIDP